MEVRMLAVCVLVVNLASTKHMSVGAQIQEYKTEPVLTPGQEARLSCKIALSDGKPLPLGNRVWLKGETPVSEINNGRFRAVSADSLIIDNPSYADVGMYILRFNMATQDPWQYNCSVRFLGEPLVEDLGRPFNRAVGQKLELICQVKGYPAVITWFKDDDKITSPSSTRVQLKPVNDQEDAYLQITDLNATDSGVYKCQVWSDFFNKTISTSVLVRVTETYAAIWPFLGLSAEVILLSIIIFLYERYQTKKSQTRGLNQQIYSQGSGKKRKAKVDLSIG